MIELLIPIANFSVSVGGLVAFFVTEDIKKKELVISAVLSTIVVISLATGYSYYRHIKQIDRIQEEIINNLPPEGLTFDDLYINIFPPVSHELLREALYTGIEGRLIGYRSMHLQSNGRIMSVKVFYPK
jgi:hypothetical protein